MFTAEQWAARVLREHEPSAVDRCDVWRIHQVLWASLRELLRGALRPGWIFTRLELNGSLARAGLMLISGTLWLWVATTTLIGLATLWHTGVSPYMAFKSAAVHWSPRALIVVLASSTGIVAAFAQPHVMCVPRFTARGFFRVLGHGVPAVGLFHVVLEAVPLVLVPELVLPTPFAMHMWTGVGYIVVLAVTTRGGAGIPLRWRIAQLAGGLAGWVLSTTSFANAVLPATLEPPTWLYFWPGWS